jgi:hypothetical protein
MITVMRTGAIAPGKTGEALAFAHQIAKYMHEKYGATIHLLVPVGGNPGRLGFRSEFANLAEWEARSAKLLADAEYMELLAKNAAFFLPGSVNDDIWRSI